MDPPEVSAKWAKDKGFEFALLSDPEMQVIRDFGLVNEDVGDLALHAVFILDEEGQVFYRKVARRRAYASELLAAIDYHYAAPEPAAPAP